MSDSSMNAGSTQGAGQESITDAVRRGDVERDAGAQTPSTDPFDPSQTADHSNDPNYAKDPVCGVWVDKRTAKDTLPAPVNMPMDTLYFSSPECKALFEEDPERYGSNF